MTAEQLKGIVYIVVEMNCLPASYLADLRTAVREGMAEKNPDALFEMTIDCLSLSVEYMGFDLEATRRENEYLRSMLENMSNGD